MPICEAPSPPAARPSTSGRRSNSCSSASRNVGASGASTDGATGSVSSLASTPARASVDCSTPAILLT
eukprot:scaffold119604_cov65-Phaeocystis_antarctica.AAC.4